MKNRLFQGCRIKEVTFILINTTEFRKMNLPGVPAPITILLP